jgi:hypothetical protein
MSGIDPEDIVAVDECRLTITDIRVVSCDPSGPGTNFARIVRDLDLKELDYSVPIEILSLTPATSWARFSFTSDVTTDVEQVLAVAPKGQIARGETSLELLTKAAAENAAITVPLLDSLGISSREVSHYCAGQVVVEPFYLGPGFYVRASEAEALSRSVFDFGRRYCASRR